MKNIEMHNAAIKIGKRMSDNAQKIRDENGFHPAEDKVVNPEIEKILKIRSNLLGDSDSNKIKNNK